MKRNSISIIGTGALGSVLAKAVYNAGYQVSGVFNRTKEKAKKTAYSIGMEEYSNFPQKKYELGDLTFLTLPDRHIARNAARLAALYNNFSDYTFAHCSGNKSSGILKPLKDKGASVASFHPLQTFTAQSVASDFEGIYIDMEGDNKAIATLENIATAIGAQPMLISAEAKPYLHAAAVMASNNLVGLVEAATQIAALGGIEKNDAQNALMPLIKQTVENIISSDDIGQALSGPVARGDTPTVREHMQLLEQNPQLNVLYQQLGNILAEIAEKQGRINPQQHDEIRTIFEDLE